ncbi:phospholipase D-like domain-containing protein [Candidatus Ruminimicrobium bovinum]|uniref:phospholipase D-like domain-containing protein n=1 Tax=Candidatus Ruminimicrobium bovinum TaxID=3242779 RepID=UPI0039B9CFE3
MFKFHIKYFLTFFLILLFLPYSYGKSVKIDLAKIANYTVNPKRVFVIKNKLFIDYDLHNLYLTVKIPKHAETHKIKRLKLDAEKIIKKEDKIEEIKVLSDEIYQKIISELNAQYDIEKELLEYEYQTELGETKKLKAEINLPDKSTNIKKNLKAEKKLDKQNAETLFNNFIEITKKHSDNNGKLFILSKNINNIVYLYVDTDNKTVIPLILPPYQKAETNNNFFVETGDFLYSFIIKNHIVPIVKSPFTSVYRLFSTASSTLNAFTPNINENFYSDSFQNESDTMDLNDFNKFLDEELETKEFKANVKLFIDGEDFFNNFIDSLKLAKHSVFIETYIFKTDSFATEIINLLKEKSKSTDIRVLIDNFGSLSNKKIQDPIIKNDDNDNDIVKTLKQNSNIKVRLHPDTWLISDHRKIFLIDRKKAYIGGMNIATEYRYTWHDLMVSLEGPIVYPIAKMFYKVWSFSGLGGDFAVAYRSLFTKSKVKEQIYDDNMINVRILTTNSTDYQIYDAQLEAIRRARKRIYIENPYFTEKTLVEELVFAKRRGVDVKIIFPAVNDMVLYDKMNLKIANYFIENGIEVYLYPKMAHVKAAIYDDWACLGSANFNKLSMFKNREINIAFYDKKLVDELLEKLFIKDFEVSQKYEEPVDIPVIYYLM